MFEKWKKVLDNGRSCGALLVDLSIASYCIVHDLLLAKQSAYGFDYNSLKRINSFLSGRKFRTKIRSCYNPYLDLLVSVPQVSSWVLCFLIYTSAIFFNMIVNLMSLITQRILSFIIVNQIWTLSLVNVKKAPLQFLHGFRITISKLRAENNIF